MSKLSWRDAFASLIRRSPAGAAAALLAALLLAGCGELNPAPAVKLSLAPATATPTATATATATPTPTPTPLPTPTPVAAVPVGQLPAGQLFFAVAREDQLSPGLWHMAAGGELSPLLESVEPGGWDCRGGEAPLCLAAGDNRGGAVLAVPVDGSAPALLDLLTPVTPTTRLSETLALQEAVTATVVGLHAAVAPDGQWAALATPRDVRIYDLVSGQLTATLMISGTTALAWSPAPAALAVVAEEEGSQRLALWRSDRSNASVLALTAGIGHLTWAPTGWKLAFDARHGPSLHDVFVANLDTGEIRNLTELYLREKGQVAAWRPLWEADGSALRYIRGRLDDPARQTVVRHPLDTWRTTALWPVTDEGLTSLAVSPDGLWYARLIEREGRQVVQVRPADDSGWQDATASTFEDVTALAWGPPTAAGSGRYLLAVRPQALVWIDPEAGQDGDILAVCATCRIAGVRWQP